MKPALLREVETSDGSINVVIDDCWVALFPKESNEQIKFLIECVKRSLEKRSMQ